MIEFIREETPEAGGNPAAPAATTTTPAPAAPAPAATEDPNAAKAAAKEKIKSTASKANKTTIPGGTTLEDEIKRKKLTPEQKLGIKKPRKPGSGRPRKGTHAAGGSKPSIKPGAGTGTKPDPAAAVMPPDTDPIAQMINSMLVTPASLLMNLDTDKTKISKDQEKILLAVRPESMGTSVKSPWAYWGLMFGFPLANTLNEFLQLKIQKLKREMNIYSNKNGAAGATAVKKEEQHTNQ